MILKIEYDILTILQTRQIIKIFIHMRLFKKSSKTTIQ